MLDPDRTRTSTPAPQRRIRSRLLLAPALAIGLLFCGAGEAAEVIKIGTLAPAASSLGHVFETWRQAVRKRTGEAVDLQFYWNGQQGDEGAMVGKMKDGQLDGATLTAVGLGKIHKPLLALQIPGLFTSWSKLDAVRDAMKGDFEKGVNDAGFILLGWADVGAAHVMSKGFAVKTPDDIKGKKPYVWRDDPIQPILFQVIGGITGVPLNVPEVLPNLNTGTVNIVIAPALSAEQLQWSSKLDTITTDTVSMMIGALVLSSKRFSALSEEHRGIIMDTGRIAALAFTKKIRHEDDQAFGRLKGKMNAVDLSGDERSKWDSIFKQTRQRLGQGTFSADLIGKLEALPDVSAPPPRVFAAAQQPVLSPPPGLLHIKVAGGVAGNRAYLSVPSDGSKADLYTSDDGTGHQRWSLQPGPDGSYYNIRVGGGVSGGRSYLSTSGDGTRVDLYDHDDGSGRQRWVLQKSADNATWNILIKDGVSGGRKYLSASGDGSHVDLWTQDDGTGHQRWVVQ